MSYEMCHCGVMYETKEQSKKPLKASLDIMDRIDGVMDLISLCQQALAESMLVDVGSTVGNVLHTHVEAELIKIKEELRNL